MSRLVAFRGFLGDVFFLENSQVYNSFCFSQLHKKNRFQIFSETIGRIYMLEIQIQDEFGKRKFNSRY